MTCAADCPDCPALAPEADPAAVPHELHVTVVPGREYHRTIQDFQRVADLVGARAVVMGVAGADGSHHVQMMTASGFTGTDSEARAELVRVGDKLASYGWDPVRAKIEAAPWHPRAVVEDTYGAGLPDGSYWESHVGLWIRPVDLTPDLLRQVHQLNGYLSRNQLRRPRVDGAERWSLSIRSQFMSRDVQQMQASFVRDLMFERGLDPDEPRTEFTWWDSLLDPKMAGGPPFATQVPRSVHEEVQ